MTRVDDVSFIVRAGEIVGIAGVAGNGQSELLEAIAGIRRAASGRMLINGKQVGIGGTADPATFASSASPMCRKTVSTWAWSSASRRTKTRSSAISAKASM